jgi:hypothetical protein
VPLPDLIVKTFSVPATVTHGVEATGGAMYVENLGPGVAGPFTVTIRASCAQEFYSAPVDVAGLAPGAEKFIKVTFTLNSTGDCHAGATIDDENQVIESDETNNEVSVAITVQ